MVKKLIEIDPVVWKKIKVLAAQEEKTMGTIIGDLIRGQKNE